LIYNIWYGDHETVNQNFSIPYIIDQYPFST
jgi:hypothetical protein